MLNMWNKHTELQEHGQWGQFTQQQALREGFAEEGTRELHLSVKLIKKVQSREREESMILHTNITLSVIRKGISFHLFSCSSILISH